MANNPFKIEFKLIQHTPYIHFQHEQSGATLRATELKPKLDKYLIKNHSSRIDNSWILVSELKEKALDYKIKIEINPNSIPINIPIDDFSAGNLGGTSLVLANMGRQPNEKKQFVYYKSNSDYDYKIIVFCFHKELKKIISENLSSFLMRINSGNRQSKGFGSYYLSENDPNYKLPKSNYNFQINLSNCHSDIEKFNLLFKTINIFWRALRAGINDGRRINNEFVTNFYFKSLMFAYAKKYGIQWEKKTIKTDIFSTVLARQKGKIYATPESPLVYDSTTKYLMKDMLGMSMSEKWLADFNDDIKKDHKIKTPAGLWSDPLDDGKISRLASPITFKPIFNANRTNVDVFIAINIIPSEIREKWFEIKNNSGNATHIQFPPLYTVKDFFEFLFVEKDSNSNYKFNLASHVDEKFKVQNNRPHEKWVILNDIFNQIRNNYPQES